MGPCVSSHWKWWRPCVALTANKQLSKQKDWKRNHATLVDKIIMAELKRTLVNGT